MLTAEANVQTDDPGRYLVRLCQHAGKMDSRLRHRPRTHNGGAPPEVRHTEWSETTGILVLNWGQCTLKAAPGTLTLRAEAADQDSLTRIQDLVTARLEKFGRRERLTMTWRATSPGPPDQASGSGLSSPEGGSAGAQ